MPFLRIGGLRTVNQSGQNATLFDPFGDALSLTMDLQASADLLALSNAAFTAEFQIFDPHTHKVVVSTYYGSAFSWGSSSGLARETTGDRRQIIRLQNGGVCPGLQIASSAFGAS